MSKREEAQEADEGAMEGASIKTDDLMILVNEIVPFHMKVSAAETACRHLRVQGAGAAQCSGAQ